MKRILLISTGGTMGMQMVEEGILDSTQFVQEIFAYIPDVSQVAQIDMVCPFTMDSTDVGISQWQKLGQILYEKMDDYDGFVIIHGTDTMSFTACALSFMMVNLPKPVILTGSQRPLAALRTDARSNLINAIELATKGIPEVCVFFSNKLYRGNRTKKISIDEFDAFSSPNYPPLAAVGLNIERVAEHRKPSGIYRIEDKFDNRVIALQTFPSINPGYWQAVLQTDVQIVVIEAFGAGNLPTQSRSLIPVVKTCVQQGKLVVLCSQSMEGSCSLDLYDGGKQAREAGAISAGDMTLEATIVKSMFLLGLFEGNVRRVRHHFSRSIAGEVSVDENSLIVK